MPNPIISSAYATIAIMFVGLIMASIVSIEEKAKWISEINNVPVSVSTKYCSNPELTGSGVEWCRANNYGMDGFTNNTLQNAE